VGVVGDGDGLEFVAVAAHDNDYAHDNDNDYWMSSALAGAWVPGAQRLSC
jgi:hypothetical protein